jgi:hypothetical protein
MTDDMDELRSSAERLIETLADAQDPAVVRGLAALRDALDFLLSRIGAPVRVERHVVDHRVDPVRAATAACLTTRSSDAN